MYRTDDFSRFVPQAVSEGETRLAPTKISDTPKASVSDRRQWRKRRARRYVRPL